MELKTEADLALPAAELDTILQGRSHLMVLAPHPDDEVFGCGGLIQRALAAGKKVDVVVVTDGDACYSDLSPRERTTMAAQRRAESRIGAGILGLELEQISFWRRGDGLLSSQIPELVQAILPLAQADVCFAAPWRHDTHPDHDALGIAAWQVQQRTGAALCEYFIWSRAHSQHWPAVYVARPHRLVLSRQEQEIKKQAAEHFSSQLQGVGVRPPIVEAYALEAFTSQEEWFLC